MALLPSWVAGANDPQTDFPLNNLPYGVFSTNGGEPRCGVAIGDMILDAKAAEAAGLTGTQGLCQDGVWNPLMAAGSTVWARFRQSVTDLLARGSPHADALRPMLHRAADAQLHLPLQVAEFTDFYASRQHATNVGTMFRGAENALPPNWLDIPIGYNGRASTVVVSGTPIHRPNGQTRPQDAPRPVFGPSSRLDIELEIGTIIGTPSRMGQPVTTDQARQMIFGHVLLNDWSARDIQAWEYQPLGPFQAKAFATSISPWIVTTAALEPFAVPTPPRDHDLLPYLSEATPGLFDITLSVALSTGGDPQMISRTNMRHLYYSPAQQLAHHASSGCAMRTGDLLGTGTISGDDPDSLGSLLELTWGGERPLALADGQTRRFLQDHDTVTLAGHAQGDGYRVGFGTCTGRILPAPAFP
ncbi:fumarylacetoacetase [Paracoccus sp. SM22M-07]|uniref:fumarylacetoacetase n=1 Tax=Paracoccus sp. SM22M-07 TaxID=1520813 RepID=UPI0009185CA7|nr:fumarylacetoacetase [Paracoccus sp. SM22M-07]OJH44244.1 fumarylacetoacetase [Paracoccus sp. SM22M-07]